MKKIQAGYKVQTLSVYLKQPAPPAAPPVNFPKVDKQLVKTNFFDYLDFSLQFAPPGPEEKEIRAKLTSGLRLIPACPAAQHACRRRQLLESRDPPPPTYRAPVSGAADTA